MWCRKDLQADLERRAGGEEVKQGGNDSVYRASERFPYGINKCKGGGRGQMHRCMYKKCVWRAYVEVGEKGGEIFL